jgi:hypothetical protein
MKRIVIAVCVLLVALTGCKAKELADKAAISADLQKRGTTDLMKEVSNDEYTPPEDGRLTEAQVQMYLKVREHEKKIAQVAKDEMKAHAEEAKKEGEKSIGGLMAGFKAMGSAADLMTADIRAAKDLGYNTQEYLWIKGQILAASSAKMASSIAEGMNASMQKAYADTKKAYDEAKDEQTKKMYAEMLAGYDKSKQEMQQQEQDPAVAWNQQLLSKHENALNAIAHEWSKFEDKEGEAEKGMQEFEKKVEEAKKQ